MEYYYQILGVRNNATSDEIKQAYRKKAKLYHPDINPSPEAKEMFLKIQDAYDILLGGKPLPRTINPYPSSNTTYSQRNSTQSASYKTSEKTYKGGVNYNEYKRKQAQDEKRQDIFNDVFSTIIIILFFSALVGLGGGLSWFISTILITVILLSPQWIRVIGPLKKFKKGDYTKCLENYKNLNWAFSLAIPFYCLILMRISFIEEITRLEVILSSIILFLISLKYFLKETYTNKWGYIAISALTATNIYLFLRIMMETF